MHDAGRHRSPRRTLLQRSTFIAIVLLLAACSTAGGAASPPPTGPSATTKPTPTPVPGATGAGVQPGGGTGGAGTGGGGTGGNPGIGITLPGGGAIFPPGPADNPLFSDTVTPITRAPGQRDPRPVNVQLVRAVIPSDGTVNAELRWWSGVAPCNVLDSVQMTKDDSSRTITLTAFEGSGAGDAMCIEIAQLKATVVEIGRLASGTWTISATGDAHPIMLDVP